MLRSTLSPDLGRRLLVAGTVVVSIAVAACGDAATAPRTPAVARDIERPSEIVLKLGTLISVRVVDTANKTLTERAWVEFTTSNNDTVYIRDNSAQDSDPAVGFIKLVMLKAQTYKACMVMSEHFRGDHNFQSPFPRCSSLTSSSTKVDLGKVYARQSPQFVFLIKNQFGPVGGATVNLSVPSQNWSLNITDGQLPYDESAGSNGNITYTTGYPNTVTWCAQNAPSAKHTLLSPKCGTINTAWGKTYTITLQYEEVLY